MKKNESSVEYISTPHNVEQRGGERCCFPGKFTQRATQRINV